MGACGTVQSAAASSARRFHPPPRKWGRGHRRPSAAVLSKTTPTQSVGYGEGRCGLAQTRGQAPYPRHCERSEAIQSFEPQGSGLLRRFAPRNDEIKIRSRDALRPRLANHEDDSPPSSHDPEKWCPVFGPDHAQERGERSAERRIQPMSAPHRQTLPPANARGAEARQKSGRARLPALHCGTRQGFDPLAQLQAMLPGTRSRRALPALILSQSRDCTSRTGRSTGVNDARSRPGADCESARGRRTRSAS